MLDADDFVTRKPNLEVSVVGALPGVDLRIPKYICLMLVLLLLIFRIGLTQGITEQIYSDAQCGAQVGLTTSVEHMDCPSDGQGGYFLYECVNDEQAVRVSVCIAEACTPDDCIESGTYENGVCNQLAPDVWNIARCGNSLGITLGGALGGGIGGLIIGCCIFCVCLICCCCCCKKRRAKKGKVIVVVQPASASTAPVVIQTS